MARDLFSQQAGMYAQYRPVYPPELYEYILSFVEKRQAAWDCATGNGQAALELSKSFQKVYATDISQKQLDQAPSRPNIEYAAVPAEQSGFANHIFDLITIAQAYHWLQFNNFRHEAERVARAGAIIAVWGYSLMETAQAGLNAAIQHFYRDITGPWWDPERKYIDEGYTTIPFPYEELPSRTFRITVKWKKEDLAGYLRTWSALQHFMKAKGYDPVTDFAGETDKLWDNHETIDFSFPVFVRLGRINP